MYLYTKALLLHLINAWERATTQKETEKLENINEAGALNMN